MVESRVDVKTGNEEEESLEAGIPTFEEIQQVEKNENSKIVDMLFTGVCVLLVLKIVVHGTIFKLNRWRKKEEHDLVSFDCVFLSQENADTTLECENEPSPDFFQEVKICSWVEVVVRITDDIPLLNWIPHFAMRFFNKKKTGRRWKKSVVQFGEEELISFGETHNSKC